MTFTAPKPYKIIDSILDYSKLEAEALRIEINPFTLEDVIADCMELLLPTAVKKVDMSFNIEPDVPRWVAADYARIRQVLMNLLGNGLKFTSEGFVHAICSIDSSTPCGFGEVSLKFVIRDSGIGLCSLLANEYYC
jgi:signal transduction histidine kinase